MASPLVPARLALAPDGTPWSETYGDVYHSAGGGLAQARHVFLAGNGLPERFRQRERFTVLETGFGYGLNFLATWQAWKEAGRPCARLHFVSIEKHPFAKADLVALLARHPELAAEGQALCERWPVLVPGLHRLELEQGRVVLTLGLGDIADVLPELDLAADAIYLDGFAPARNPEMWAHESLRALQRLVARGATLATWSVAAPVREALHAAGFATEKRAGFDRKRDMLVGHALRGAEPATPPFRRAIVVGAGLAGAGVAERLAHRGWDVEVLERRDAPALEASGNPAGAFHPVVSPDDSLFARFTRAGYLHALARWPDLEGLAWSQCGVLQLARDEDERASQAKAMAVLGYPADYASFDGTRGGLWFPRSGWIQPPGLVRALLSRRERVRVRFGVSVASLRQQGGEWAGLDASGAVVSSAPVLVLANAADALRLAPQPEARLRTVRGQLSLVPPLPIGHVLLRGGLALPAVDGRSVVGASFDIDDDDPEVRVDSHEGNLERLEQMLPGAAAGLDPSALPGRVAFRAVVRDRLPMIGPLPDERGPGLFAATAYGSRGLLWCGLAGEIIASRLEGDPLPVERRLAAAVAPSRFAERAARRGRSARVRGMAGH